MRRFSGQNSLLFTGTGVNVQLHVEFERVGVELGIVEGLYFRMDVVGWVVVGVKIAAVVLVRVDWVVDIGIVVEEDVVSSSSENYQI